MIPILHLHVKHIYFSQMRFGEKLWEYRLFNDYWKKRLIDREYEEAWVYDGYPKAGNEDKILKYSYLGFKELPVFRHVHFGPGVHHVFAIDLSKRKI